MQKQIFRFLNNIRLKQAQAFKTPPYIIFFLTNRCNARCPHCFYWKQINQPLDELTTEEISKIVEKLDCRDVGLTGGEPTLRDDLEEICSFFLRKRKLESLTIVSNGLLPEYLYQVLKKISTSTTKKIFLQLPADGLKDTHEAIRGEGSFDKLCQSIELVKNLKNVGIYLVTTISRLNMEEVGKTLIFFSKYKNCLLKHHFNLTRAMDQFSFNLDEQLLAYHRPKDESLLLSPEEMVLIYNQLLELNRKYHVWTEIDQQIMEYIIKILKEKRKILNCYAGRLQAVIYPNGDVSFCEFTKPVANLRDFDYEFKRLWFSPKANLFRRLTRNCFCLHPCNLSVSLLYHEEPFLNIRLKDKKIIGRLKLLYEMVRRIAKRR